MKISKLGLISTVAFLGISAGLIICTSLNGSPALTDGTYKASAQGKNAPIELEVVIKGGKPSAVNVLAQEETFFAAPAIDTISAQFLKGTPIDKIDAVSGATITSNATKEAISKALKKAAPADGSYNDGSYKVSVQGKNAPIELEVVISGGKPSAVNVLAQEETFFAAPAIDTISAQFLKGTSIDKIDAVSGATITSEATKNALRQALEQASAAE
ncbi:MAG: FMN-binding protein [Treponema sp.]|nr:FMN-binding protein [Candidatus Treponema equifaecale]